MVIKEYRLKLQRRERVVQTVVERGYEHIVSQIIMDNHRASYPKDRDERFLEALREEYGK